MQLSKKKKKKKSKKFSRAHSFCPRSRCICFVAGKKKKKTPSPALSPGGYEKCKYILDTNVCDLQADCAGLTALLTGVGATLSDPADRLPVHSPAVASAHRPKR